MNLQALSTIGDTILNTEFSDGYPYGAFTTPWTLDDADLDLILKIKFGIDDEGTSKEFPDDVGSVSFVGTEWKEVEDVISVAERHMYAHRDQHIDYSLSRRVTSNSYSKRFTALCDWVEGAVEDEVAGPVVVALADELASTPEELQQVLEEADSEGDEKALLAPVFVEPNGTERYLGEIPSVCERTRANVVDAYENASAAKGAAGDGVCACCNEETTVYGMGANNIGAGRILPFKQQGPFPGFTAADSWRSRPLCADCIQKVGVAFNGFIDAQKFNIPQIRCRILPYAIGGDNSNLRDLVRRFRSRLPEPGEFDDEDAEDEATVNAFIDTLDRYRSGVDEMGERDNVRLFVMFYQQNKAKVNGIHSLEGISHLSVLSFLETYDATYSASPITQCDALQKKLYSGEGDNKQNHNDWFTPTKQQLLSGYWFFAVFFNERNRKGNGESTPDPGGWRTMFEGVIADEQIAYEEVIREGIREIEQNRDEDYDWGFHLSGFLRLHHFLEACDAEGYLEGLHTTYPTMKGINETYGSYGAAVESILEKNPGLSDSSGRTAAFTLGVLASRLSDWQTHRNVNQKFVGTHSITQLDPGSADEWVTQIWDKALTYNQQENNGGVPWKGVFNAFHEAYTEYEAESTPVTSEEFRYYYIMGVNTGSALTVESEPSEDRSEESAQADN